MAIAQEDFDANLAKQDETQEQASDEELEQLAPSEEASVEESPEEMIYIDEESMALINVTTGEVVGYQEIAPEDVGDIDLAKWVGDRRTYHKAKLEGIKAEKQLWIDTINSRYDARIKRHEGAIKWLETTYEDFLFQLAKRLIGTGKKRSVAVGMLLLKLRKTSAKTEVLDEEKALAWLKKAGVTEAVKVKESVLVSMLPDDLKQKLVKESNQEKTGIAFYPGGEETLKIE